MPLPSERRHIDKETINESVYGQKWRDKINKTALKERGGSTLQKMPEISTTEIPTKHKHKKKNLNDLNSLYMSSEEEDTVINKQESEFDDSRVDTQATFQNYFDKRRNASKKSQSQNQRQPILKPQFLDKRQESPDVPIFRQEFTLESDYNSLLIPPIQKTNLINKKHFHLSQRIGEQAIYDYYKNYKNLKKSIERDEHTKFSQASYIFQCEQQKLIPRPYGIVNWKGTEEEINVENFMMGDDYAKAYGQGLQLLNATKINLANNRLLEKGIFNILKGINKDVQEIDLSSNKVGLNSIDYLGSLFQRSEGFALRVIKIENSGITDFQLSNLIDALLKCEKIQLVELNLARNLITDIGAEKVANFLQHNNCELKILNLYWNKLKVKGGLKIADAIQKNQILRILDLSWNSLGKLGVTFMGQMTTQDIKRKLRGQQMNTQEQAVDQFTEQERLQSEEEIGKIWGKALKINRTLIHLDLSYNSFGDDSCKQIAHRIKKNHTLYGLHMAGNACVVDSTGFIQLQNDEQQLLTTIDKPTKLDIQRTRIATPTGSIHGSARKRSTISQNVKSPQKEVLFKRMEGVKAVIKRKNQSFGSTPQKSSVATRSSFLKTSTVRVAQSISELSNMANSQCSQLQKFKTKDNCWLCEGWSEFKFDLRISHIGAEVYLHFDFDEYKPDLMVSTSAGVYQVFRMVPPGVHYFFYSINGEYTVNANQSQIVVDVNNVNQIELKLKKVYNKAKQVFNLTKVNYVESQFQESLVNADKLEVTIKNCLPRPDKKFTAQSQDRPRTPWTFPISLFKEYRSETSNVINDCFEFDWSCLKKPKVKKCTEDELKEKCREIYPFLRQAYKRLSAIGIVGTVFSIGWNVYREFITSTLNFADKEKLKPDDCDRLFIGVNANQQRKSPFIPEKALVRFQLLEIMIKASLKKYFESGDVQDELQAIELFNVNYLQPHNESSSLNNPYMYDQQRWREERYYNEACDNIFKAFASLFTYLYNTFGGSHKKPGQKTFMTLDEFDMMIQQAGLINDILNSRDIPVFFNLAMILQLNEIDYERHLQATYIEFLEAYARVCDEASIMSYSQTNEQADNGQQDFIMSEEERHSLPLHVKIENSIPYLLKNCCVKGFLDKFDMPKKHPIVGLYILPNKKFF